MEKELDFDLTVLNFGGVWVWICLAQLIKFDTGSQISSEINMMGRATLNEK